MTLPPQTIQPFVNGCFHATFQQMKAEVAEALTSPVYFAKNIIPIWITECNILISFETSLCPTGIHVPTWRGRGLWLKFRKQRAVSVHHVIIPIPSIICYHASARSYPHIWQKWTCTHTSSTPQPSCEFIFSSDLSCDVIPEARHKSLLPLQLLWHPVHWRVDVLAGQLGVTVRLSSWPVIALVNILS